MSRSPFAGYSFFLIAQGHSGKYRGKKIRKFFLSHAKIVSVLWRKEARHRRIRLGSFNAQRWSFGKPFAKASMDCTFRKEIRI